MPEFRIDQIETYLKKHNMFVDTIYSMDGECVFLKIKMNKVRDYFYMYISSRYTIATSDDYENIEIKYIDLSETEEVAEDFANIDHEEFVEEDYDNLENNDNSIENIVRSYNKQLEIKDYKKLNDFKEIIRGIKRLRFCVSNQNIKIGIIFSKFLCCVKKDNSLDTYEIKGSENNLRQLYIFVDIDTFFQEGVIDTFSQNSKFIKNGIYNLLKNNKAKNKRKLDKMFNNYNSLLKTNDTIVSTYESLKREQEELYLLLLKNLKNQETIKIEMKQKETYYTNKNTVAADIDKSRILLKYDKKLQKLLELEKQIEKAHTDCKVRYENAVLSLDKIYFENIIMFNTIIENLNSLKKI